MKNEIQETALKQVDFDWQNVSRDW